MLQAPTEAELKDAEPRTRNIIDTECGCVLNVLKTDKEVMEHARPLIINILAKDWEEEDVPGLIEKAAIRAGTERVYAE